VRRKGQAKERFFYPGEFRTMGSSSASRALDIYNGRIKKEKFRAFPITTDELDIGIIIPQEKKWNFLHLFSHERECIDTKAIGAFHRTPP